MLQRLDVIRETAPAADIFYCSILPRAPAGFSGHGYLSPEIVRACQHWVTCANQALQDFATRIPYVRFYSMTNAQVL